MVQLEACSALTVFADVCCSEGIHMNLLLGIPIGICSWLRPSFPKADQRALQKRVQALLQKPEFKLVASSIDLAECRHLEPVLSILTESVAEMKEEARMWSDVSRICCKTIA